MAKILVIEDSVDSFQLIKRALGGMTVDWAKSVSEANQYLKGSSYDLILLDIVLPDGDGFRLCSILQTNDQLSRTPVIFLSAKNAVGDKVLGFSVGAEDFITKPFDSLELKARVDARIKKRTQEQAKSELLQVGDIAINRASQTVEVLENGKTTSVDLTPIEFKMLCLLAKDPNTVQSREKILNNVWGDNIHVYSRSVDTHISKLRKKLLSKSNYIESVHGTGYRMNAPEPEMGAALNTESLEAREDAQKRSFLPRSHAI